MEIDVAIGQQFYSSLCHTGDDDNNDNDDSPCCANQNTRWKRNHKSQKHRTKYEQHPKWLECAENDYKSRSFRLWQILDQNHEPLQSRFHHLQLVSASWRWLPKTGIRHNNQQHNVRRFTAQPNSAPTLTNGQQNEQWIKLNKRS